MDFKRKIKLYTSLVARTIFFPVCFVIVLLLRLIRPILVIRWGGLISHRIGHFAANTELYLCEKENGINIPKGSFLDIHYFLVKPVCNHQLALMWKRTLRIWPTWIFNLLNPVNRLIPGWEIHEIGNNTQGDRDVHNLLDTSKPHLSFNKDEIEFGELQLRKMGIPEQAKIVCIIVRDNIYLQSQFPGEWSYHNYRDSNIQNFLMAAEELTKKGYYVLRMGAKVKDALQTSNPMIIDYGFNGMRTDFMDIYIGYKCTFCISTATGWDAVPDHLFRRPIVYVNNVPLGIIATYREKNLIITKMSYSAEEKRNLTMKEIFSRDVGFAMATNDYSSKGIQLIENTAEEICSVVMEMEHRLNGTWTPKENDESLQSQFWNIFPTDATDPVRGKPYHGKIKARFGADFLRNNEWWLKS
ncbi:TIGR04372 family glycosyltransferase [Leptospira limi]|uniref:TIGR04372 family glycosyltransferase n=1 Tax=Leptospira limi TaxID=2950023 RepID=A0ABT3LZ41_9LEPT|nr:TIGR04372 family glycosyltransferase [Leptospira limi]MCW7462990.1 TIGR04372 family glycosyltransferase [Leptospira limi]